MSAGVDGNKDWVEVQKTSFTRWANSYLSQRGLHIHDLTKDLCDGVLLIQLLEILTDSKLPRYNQKPRIAVQRMANLNVALDFMRAQGFKLVNVGAVDIENGNIKIILGLIWTTIMKYQIQKSAQNDAKRRSSVVAESSPEDDTAKNALLKWVNDQIKSYGCPEVKNFTSHFQDGKVLMALTDSMAPGTLDMSSFIPDALSNVTAALNTAESEFGIPILVDAETVVNSPDDLGMMAYVSFFQNFKATHQFHVKPRPELVEEEETTTATEPPKETTKETTKEIPKETPKETPKEAPKESKLDSLVAVQMNELFAGTKIESRSPRKVANLTLKKGMFGTLGADFKHNGGGSFAEAGSFSASPRATSSGIVAEAGTTNRQPLTNTAIDQVQQVPASSSLSSSSSYSSSSSSSPSSSSFQSDLLEAEQESKYAESVASPHSALPPDLGSSSFYGDEVKEAILPWTMDFPDKFTDVKDAPLRSPEQIRQEEDKFQTIVHDEAIQGLPVADSGGYHRAVSDPAKPRVEFTVGCIALAKQGFRSKTNPMVGLFEIAGSKLLLVDTTEWLVGDHDPVFSKPLVVRFANDVTDKHKQHRLVVWHVEMASNYYTPPLISDRNLIGFVDVSLPDISAIPAKKVVRLPLNSAIEKQDKKLKQKHSTLVIARRYAGLRLGQIENFNHSNVRKGARVDVRVSVFGQQGRNPLVAIFELGPAKQNMFVLGQTEWVKSAGTHVNFRTRVSLYDRGVANTQRYLRICLFNVVAPGKKAARGTGSRVPVPCQDKDLVGYRDITFHELLVALRVNRDGLSYPFFGANKQAGRGSFTLRGRIFDEIPDVQFVGVNKSWLQNHTGHELEIAVKCHGLVSLEDTRLTEPANPVAALFEKNERGEFHLVGQTEWQKSEYDPTFNKRFHLYSDLQTPCEYRLNVYDLDMEAFDEQQDLKGNTNYAELPTLTAVDGMLTTEPALVGVVYFTLNQLAMSAAMGGVVVLPLTYPSAMEQSIVQARGEHAMRQAQNRINTLLSKKASVTLNVQVYHAMASPNNKPHQETPPANSVCTFPYLGTKEVNQKGHEITMVLSASRLPKFDWNGRGDPIVALLERVKVNESKMDPPPAVAAVAVTTWECPACTFQNKELFLVCEMCGSNKPADLLGAEGKPNPVVKPKAVPAWHEWKLLGQTEWINDTPDPVFKRQLAVCFDPSEEDKELRLAVYDADNTTILHEDMIGYADLKLSRLAEWADDHPFYIDLRSERQDVEAVLRSKRSQLSVCAHLGLVQDEKRIAAVQEGAQISIANLKANSEVSDGNELIVTVGGQNLLKLNWNMRNPMLAVLKESVSGNGKFEVLIANTEFVSKARSECVFQTPLHIPFDSPERILRFAVFDVATESVSLENDLMGYVDVAYQQLLQVALPFTDKFVRVEGMLIGGAHAAGAPKWQLRVYMQSSDPTLQDGLHKRKSGLCFFVQEKSAAGKSSTSAVQEAAG